MNEISKLIGHKYILNELIYLEQIKKLPNKILLNGPKGIGKKLLVNHLLNYFYSKNNEQFYNLKSNEYNQNNNLSKMISANTHPNIFKIKKKKIKKKLKLIKLEKWFNLQIKLLSIMKENL